MPTHDKTIYCSVCRQINALKQKWYRSRCRECQSWGSSWHYYYLFHLISQHHDDQIMLKRMNRKINSILRWCTQELPTVLDIPTEDKKNELLGKLLAIADK